MKVEYVGHPFFDEIAERRLDQKFIARWKSWDGLQVVVLPGSRSREVKSIWPMQLTAIRELAKRHPKTRFLDACYKDRHCLACQRAMTAADKQLNLEFFFGRTSELIEIADCSLMKSGSVSLEMMARHKPSVVVYHVMTQCLQNGGAFGQQAIELHIARRNRRRIVRDLLLYA